jgi:hypothetical protein
VIERWISNGTDLLHSKLLDYKDNRIFPAGLSHESNGVTYHAFRAQFMSSRYSRGRDLWPIDAEAWYGVDTNIYNDQPTDGFVIGVDKSGMVQSVESDALRVALHRA